MRRTQTSRNAISESGIILRINTCTRFNVCELLSSLRYKEPSQYRAYNYQKMKFFNSYVILDGNFFLNSGSESVLSGSIPRSYKALIRCIINNLRPTTNQVFKSRRTIARLSKPQFKKTRQD